MNCIICLKNGTVRKVIKNAVRKAKLIEGDNGSWVGKPELFDIVWTEQELTPVYDLEGNQTGYVETASDITPATPLASHNITDRIDRATKLQMLERLSDLAQFSFEDIDTAIDGITTMAGMRTFIKRHAKVTLALIKLLEEKL